MRAVVHDRYGPPDVLRIEEVERPVPGKGEVLVKIWATTVNRTDCHRRAASPFLWRLFAGLRRPGQQILGSEFAGEVETAGPAVTGFTAGDQVFGLNPGLLGAHAEYLRMPQDGLIADKPAGTDFEEAARSATERSTRWPACAGQAVCNTKNLDLARSLGASQVIDYTAEDFTSNGQAYDIIYDAAGKHSFSRCKGSLKPGGTYLTADGRQNLALALRPARGEGKKVLLAIPPRPARQDLLFLRQLIESGKYRAVIDRRYPLEQAARAARYVETRQKTGNVILTINDRQAR